MRLFRAETILLAAAIAPWTPAKTTRGVRHSHQMADQPIGAQIDTAGKRSLGIS
jgi:hypothetical protein